MTSLFCGIDYHKNTCTFHIIDQEGKLLEKGTKQTLHIVQFLANKKNLKIGVEASGGVNHFVDRLKAGGHEVVIINPTQFRLVGIGGKKTDEKDAKALAEGVRLNFFPEVHHKSLKAREIKSLLVSRELIVNTRVRITNHIRGTLREQGLPIAAGKNNFFTQVGEKINAVKNAFIRETLRSLLDQARLLLEEEDRVEQRLRSFTRGDDQVKRLQTIPGIGLLGSLALVAVSDGIERFKDSKSFASYLGLVPKECSSGNKRMMGSITRSGSEICRRMLIHGARSVMKNLKPGDRDCNKVWARKLKDRCGMNKATVALAHRLSRISFNVLKDGSSYMEPRTDEKENFSTAA